MRQCKLVPDRAKVMTFVERAGRYATVAPDEGSSTAQYLLDAMQQELATNATTSGRLNGCHASKAPGVSGALLRARLWQERSDRYESVALECTEVLGDFGGITRIGDLRLRSARPQDFTSNRASLQQGDVAYLHVRWSDRTGQVMSATTTRAIPTMMSAIAR